MSDREAAYHRSFTAMRNALRAIISYEGECSRTDEDATPCECPTCIAKAALEGEEDWRFMGYKPERRRSMPRELAMHAAWKHYFTRSAGRADGTSAPLDGIFAQILGDADADTITERDWFVATTVVRWLATNVGQCVLFDAGYKEHEAKSPVGLEAEVARQSQIAATYRTVLDAVNHEARRAAICRTCPSNECQIRELCTSPTGCRSLYTLASQHVTAPSKKDD